MILQNKASFGFPRPACRHRWIRWGLKPYVNRLWMKRVFVGCRDVDLDGRRDVCRGLHFRVAVAIATPIGIDVATSN